MSLKYATLCTGLGGFDAGFDDAGMECVYQCEKDRDCLRVLNRHWPDVPKSEDVNDGQTILDLVRLRPDVIAFGSPCQDLSVAGRRGGLAAERSGLFFRCVECCFACEAPWVVWENVPGVFSSQHGADFASVLEAFTGFRPTVPANGWRNSGVCIGPLYSVAWAVLDAQWFGVPQSRNRVFLVGSLGDRAGPYEILSLAESVPWDSPPSREARTRTAGGVDQGVDGSRIDGRIAGALNSGGNNGGFRTEPGEHLIPVDFTNGIITGKDLCGTLEAAQAKGNRGHGLIVPFDTTQITSPGNYSNPKPGAPCHPLSSSGHPPAIAYEPIPIDMRQASRGEKMTNNRPGGSSGGAPGTGIGKPGDPSPTVCGTHVPAIAFNWQAGGNTASDLGASEDKTGALSGSTTPAIAYALHARECGIGQGHNTTYLPLTKAVRRLTPLECERLQGFPDHWSRFGADGKQIADSPRYRMLGNAVVRNVAEWIGHQLMQQLVN